jgi:hypothetical protein
MTVWVRELSEDCSKSFNLYNTVCIRCNHIFTLNVIQDYFYKEKGEEDFLCDNCIRFTNKPKRGRKK